ncbi:MAG: DUF402 domain-containing protein, partial [Actinobacteria bacterium]|nr:DUF402 domain-containing protein [Actinomycetota bacterium]
MSRAPGFGRTPKAAERSRPVTVELRRYPGRPLRTTSGELLGEDEHGRWIDCEGFVMVVPSGGQHWKARHFPDGGWKVDITTPAVWDRDHCVLDDLDLDVRRQRGRVWIEDEDEFESRAAAGVYDEGLKARARRTADEIVEALTAHAPPFDITADRLLRQLIKPPSAGRAVLFDMGGVLLVPLDAAADRAAAFAAEWSDHILTAIGGGWEAGLTEAD